MTGLTMDIKSWKGSSAGLSSIQLLSDGELECTSRRLTLTSGAFGSAVTNTNKPLCPGNLPSSSAQSSGSWSTEEHTTSDPKINTYYLTSDVSVGSTDRPSVTFYPYVSSSAIYNIYLSIPGCSALGDCDGRTTVDIGVYPVQGGQGWTSTISEQVNEDTMILVYSGAVDGSTESFNPTVVLSLSADATTPSNGNTYTVVADSVVMYLTGTSETNSTGSARVSGSSANSTSFLNSTLSSNQSLSFGVYEHQRSSTASINAATDTLNNATETSLDRLGFALDAAYNASGRPSTWIINAVASVDDTLFVAGDFAASGNFSNVVALDRSTGQATALESMGLNGAVHATAVIDGMVYFGGEFTTTASSADTSDLKHLSKYDPTAKTWSSLGGGVDGAVTGLHVSSTYPSQLIVVGNFSHTTGDDSNTNTTGGYAIYDTVAAGWVTTGILYGTLSAATSSTEKQTYLAGAVLGSSQNPVNGVAQLTSTKGGATLSNFQNVDFGSTGSAAASSASASKRSLVKTVLKRSWIETLTDLRPRAMMVRDTPPTIPYTSAAAPAVLSGAFWTNSSADGKPTVTIMGGNFTETNGTTQISGVAFYSEDQTLTGPSPHVQGVVRALNVKSNSLYIGGRDVNVTGVGNGLVVYNLETNSWVTGGMSPLSAGSETLTINAIATRGDTNTIVAAGNFETAGSLGCHAVCLWDTTNAQWSAPGQGLQSGEVRAIDFAGEKADVLIVAGSFALPNGDVAYVASYSFDNSSWTPLGTLPGPALAVAVDDKNVTNIFAAGYGTDGTTPYLQHWDGRSWTEQNSTLTSGSIVQQLAFVPMTEEHDPVGAIEKDRMLMVSGSLLLDSTGNASSALYDGAAMYPYLVGTSTTGGLGAGSALFWSDNSLTFNVKHYLARGLVVLVAIAIATGLILLLVLLFFLFACINRRREKKKQPPREVFEKEGSEVSSTHQNVFNNVQAALEQSLVAGGLGGGAAAAAAAAAHRRSDPSSYGAGDDEDEDEGRETTMRYDFEGPELQPGEMSMKAAARIIILDDVQSDEWWYARDPATGREGVVPATYGESSDNVCFEAELTSVW